MSPSGAPVGCDLCAFACEITMSACVRVQVHGHDFHAVAEIPQRGGGGGPAGAAWRYVYASASEEKVVRVFAAPRMFVRSLAALRQVAWEDVAPTLEGDLWDAGVSAAAPALGLSNKAVREGDAEGDAAVGSGGGYADSPDMAPAAAKVLEVRASGHPLDPITRDRPTV